MADYLSELFFEAICYIFNIDEYCGVLLLAVIIAYALAFISLQVVNEDPKKRKRDATLLLLISYDTYALILTASLRWWISIIVIILMYMLLFRRNEKDIWKYEIEKKRVEGEVKDLLISPKVIWLNISLTWLLTQLILYIARFYEVLSYIEGGN